MKMYEIIKIKDEGKDVYSLTIKNMDNDKTEVLTVLGALLAANGWLKPCVLSLEKYEQLFAQTAFFSAYAKTLNYLSFRKRAEKEIVIYLRKKEFSPLIIEQVINKLKEQGYINDSLFIAAFIQNSLITSLKGPRKISYELKLLDCNSAEIEQCLETLYDYDMQIEQLQKIFTKQINKKYDSLTQFHKKFAQKAAELGYNKEIVDVILAENSLTEVVAINEDKILAFVEKQYEKLRQKTDDDYIIKQTIKQKLLAKKLSGDEAGRLVAQFLESRQE
ncbi:MAG: hypothetical protein ACRC6X_08785 [Culicoidibacterales bacterium]